jgi:hypothetical protein
MGLVGLIALYMKGNISIYAEILILIGAIFISTLFISYHSDSAEAIQITLLVIEELYFIKTRGDQDKDHQQDLFLLKGEGIRVDLIHEVAE